MKRISVHVAAKLWVFLCVLIVVSLKKDIVFNGILTLFAFVFIGLQRKWKIIFRYGPFYILLGILLYAIRYHGLRMIIFSEFYALMLWHLSSVFLLSWDFISTPPGEISAFLSRLHMPTGFILGILVVFRFFPTMRAELRSVYLSMKNRGLIGIKEVVCKPFKSCEYVLVPILVRLLMTADQLSVSAIARGGENPGIRNSYYERNLGLMDYFIMACWTVLLILSLWMGVV